MHKKSNLPWLWLSLSIIILDQLTKLIISHYIQLGHSIFITSFFNLVLAHNTGAAFSFLASNSNWQAWLFGSIAASISIIIIYVLYKIPKNKVWLSVALAFILGGALGNLTDRIMHGFVIDFLDFHIGNLHWPAFNLADSAIVIGVIMLLIYMLKQHKPKANN